MKRLIVLLAIVLLVSASLTGWAEVRTYRDPGISHIGLSSDSKPTTGVLPGAQFFETNTRNVFIYTGAAWVQRDDGVVAGPDTLKAPGVIAIEVKGFDKATIAWTLSAKNTHIAHMVQGKVGNAGWFSLIGLDSLLCTANKDSVFIYNYCAGLDSLRYNFLYEIGGTDAVVAVWTKKGK